MHIAVSGNSYNKRLEGMNIAINYADSHYRNAQQLNSMTALQHGVDKVIEYGPSDIENSFYLKNKEILDMKRGNGYWLWKPYFIEKTLIKMEEGDYLVYADSGSYYINSLTFLINCMKKENEDIMVFTLPDSYLEKNWSKRDAFILMRCDYEKYYNTPQRLAGFLVIKKTSFSNRFISEWLQYAQDPRIITDQENSMGEENYLGFKENRHDQTILSLLSKKYGIKCYRDPSCSISNNDKDVLERSNYPQIFDLHRMPDVLSVDDIQKRRRKIVEPLLAYWKKGKNIVLYGAGISAKKVLIFAKSNQLKIAACVVSDGQIITESNVLGVNIYHFSEIISMYEKKDIKFLVTVDIPEIYEVLKMSGYDYEIIDKKIMNSLMRV